MKKASTNSVLQKVLCHRSGGPALIVILLIVLIALFADVLSPVDPNLQEYTKKFIPPFWADSAVNPHYLGTDVLGRDLFSRLLHGARISLFIGAFSVFLGAIIGIPAGMVAGYYGGRVDQIIMRIMDVMLAFPSLLLAICIVAVLQPSLTNAVIAIGIVSIPTFCRVVRTKTISECSKEYVLADVAIGKSSVKILFNSVLRNMWGPILVILTLNFGAAILDAAGLSFLGLGAQPPLPEWGALIAEGKKYVFQASWLIIMPGIAIFLTVVCFNLLGDALRDILDPKN